MRSSRDSPNPSVPDFHCTLYPLTPSTGVQLTRRAPYFASTETPVTASGTLNWASASLFPVASAPRPTIKAAASAPILKAGDRWANRRAMKSCTSSTICCSIGIRARPGVRKPSPDGPWGRLHRLCVEFGPFNLATKIVVADPLGPVAGAKESVQAAGSPKPPVRCVPARSRPAPRRPSHPVAFQRFTSRLRPGSGLRLTVHFPGLLSHRLVFVVPPFLRLVDLACGRSCERPGGSTLRLRV